MEQRKTFLSHLRYYINFIGKDIPYMAFIGMVYLVIAGAYIKTHGFIGTDGCVYAFGAESIAQGNGFKRFGVPLTVYMPFYSVVSSIFYHVFQNAEYATRFVSILSVLVTLPFLFYLIKHVFGSYISRVSLLLIFTNTQYMQISSDVLVEGLFMLLLVISFYIYFVHLFNQPPGKTFILPLVGFSISAALATLTRPDGLFYYSLLLVIYFVTLRKKIFVRIIRVILSMLFFILPLIPQGAFQYRYVGKFQLSDKFQNHLIGGDLYANDDKGAYLKASTFRIYETLGLPLPPDVEKFPEPDDFSTFNYVFTNRGKLLKRAFYNLLEFVNLLNKGLIIPLLWLFMFIGVYQIFKIGKTRMKGFLLILLFMIGLMFSITHYEMRFILPQLFIILIFSAEGISTVHLFAQKRSVRYKIPLMALIYFILIYYPIDDNLGYIKDINEPNRYQIFKDAGAWLKEHVEHPEQSYAMATKPWVPFYTGMPSDTIPWIESPEILIRYLQKTEKDYLIVDRRQITRYRPELEALLDNNEHFPGLQLIFSDSSKREAVLIYKVLQEQGGAEND